LLDHFNNKAQSHYRENYIVAVFSDFLFQLSPADKNLLIKKYCKVNSNYCDPDIYNFNEKNITSKYINGYFFKSLFTKYIFDALPGLNNLCPI
jgi:hypothetical protein